MEKESSRNAVLRVMKDGTDRTDAEIEEITGLSHSKVSGARSALWEAGLVEPLPKSERREHTRWRLCSAERQQEARQAFRESTERRTRGRLGQKAVGERANIVVYLLSDDDVNEAVLTQLERSQQWRRARARARDLSRERQAERRSRRADLRQAMEEADHPLHFQRNVGHLRDLMDILFVIDREVEAERGRRAHGEASGIPARSWLGVARNVREVLETGQSLFRDLSDLAGEPMESCPLCGERLHAESLELDEGYIDGVVVDEAIVEETWSRK
jgi:DNA-binding transcriptional ArsR family regulator